VTPDQKIRLLTRALLFYAKGQYMIGFDGWEAPDEPNWMCPPEEPPQGDAWDQMMIEDGGVAAATLRKVYGRALTRYDSHNSLGHKASQVCEIHKQLHPCPRCAYVADRRSLYASATPREEAQ
jgi:hypothetical protein